MQGKKVSREHLESRREEITNELAKVNSDLRMELDRDIEEQAIEIEQEEVAISREHNLRKELAEIEDLLAENDPER